MSTHWAVLEKLQLEAQRRRVAARVIRQQIKHPENPKVCTCERNGCFIADETQRDD